MINPYYVNIHRTKGSNPGYSSGAAKVLPQNCKPKDVRGPHSGNGGGRV